MHPAYQTLRNSAGDIYVIAGSAWQCSTGVLKSIETRGESLNLPAYSPLPPTPTVLSSDQTGLSPADWSDDLLLAGGSGRNLILNAADAVTCTEWLRMPRVFQPGAAADTWVSGVWTIEKTGASTATLSDAAGVIANMTSGTAPFGTYTATTSGEDDYNAGDPWTVTAAEESASLFYPPCKVLVTAGTFPVDEVLDSTDGITWAYLVNTSVSVVVDPDGSAELFYGADVIATRAAGGSITSPDGAYTATATGETNYNSGVAWTAYLTACPTVPVFGVVYMKLILASGTLDKLRGPYMADYLPTDTADLKHLPIAVSNHGITQYHTGLIII